MKRTLVLTSIVVAGGLTLAVQARVAQQPPPAPDFAEIETVKDGLYMVKNGGGNTAVFVTAKGVVLVDTKNPGWGARILLILTGIYFTALATLTTLKNVGVIWATAGWPGPQ